MPTTGNFISIIIAAVFIISIIFIVALFSGSRKKTRVIKRIDIITDELDRQKKENLRLQEELKKLHSLDNLFLSSIINLTSRLKPQDIAHEVKEVMVNCLNADQVAVFLADPRGQRLNVVAHFGLNDNWLPKLIYEIDDPEKKGKVGACYEKKHRISQREFSVLDIREPYSIFDPDICFPIFFQEKKFGVVAITRTENLAMREMDLLGVVAGIAGIAFNNTQSFADIQFTAHTDPLTKLYNIGYFKDRLREELNRAKRFQHNLSVSIIDLDNFKAYNDTYGHQAGDHLLVQLSRIFSKYFDETDILARYGGDEFIVMCPETKKSDAGKIMSELLQNLETYDFARSGTKVKVAFSAGVSAYPDDATNESELIKLADQALYEAKGAGRSTVKEYHAKVEKV